MSLKLPVDPAALVDRFEALFATIARLREALKAARIQHLVVEADCWFSCPKSGECCNHALPEDRCTCGADAHNAAIDAALQPGPR